MRECEPSSRPRRLLAIDACGAVLTAAITLGLLASGIVASGVPSIAWWVLGGVAMGPAVLGAVALWRQWPPAPQLRRLAAANLVYAVASLLLVGMFRDTVTIVAVAYVIVEALVLVALAAVEWRESVRVGGAARFSRRPAAAGRCCARPGSNGSPAPARR